MRHIILAATAAVALTTGPGIAQADYPSKPVTIIVPFPAGGAVDIVGRYLSDKLGNLWGQPVIIQNQPGAGTSIGSAQVALAEADGYTLLLNSSSFVMNAAISPDLPYDLVEDFTPISIVGGVPLVLSAGPSLGATDFAGAIAVSKERPLTYATAGIGTINQFASEMLAGEAGLNLIAVHYPGGAAALTDVMGGHADFFYSSMIQALPHIEAGSLTAIVVSSEERNAALPDTPTVVELGYEGAVMEQWWGMFGPAGLDEALVAKLNADLKTVLSTEETIAFFAQTGGEPRHMAAADFSGLVSASHARLIEIAGEIGISN
jgi:tripartite-type tricarboxylate transporter receptor subunit TctC